jgi:small subunit ribosomal protein S15
MLTPKQKTKLLEAHRVHEKDTGSPESQIALFSAEIDALARHLKKHAKDNSSRVGLLKMVAKRKRLLDYLKRTDQKRYEKLVAKLGLKAK